MLIFFILILSLGQSIETFIGTSIDDFPYQVQVFDINDISEGKTYLILDQKIPFYSNHIEMMFLTTDKNDIIESINTDFKGVMDVEFFNSLTNKFGEPQGMLKPSEILEIREEIHSKDKSFKETTSRLENCEFGENPQFIIWNTQDYQILFTMNYLTNKTELRISKKFLL